MQELLTLRSPQDSPPDSSEVRVARSFDFCVVFCRLLSFCPISFGHCVVCPSFGHCVVCPSFGHCVVCPSNYSCRLPFCYFQTHPIFDIINKKQLFNQYYKKTCTRMYLLFSVWYRL